MNTKEYIDITKNYRKYIIKKSFYNALSFISLYSIAILLISLTPISFDVVFLKNKNDPWNSFTISTIETVKAIYDVVPLKDNILTALGALVLTLFINVQSENKEINRKPKHEASAARAYKTFSDIIIIYILGPIMFINFWAKILLSGTINSNDQTAPWVSLFFMFFILMVRSLEGDTVDSVRNQIRKTELRKSVINVHSRTLINPKYNDILYQYEHQKLLYNLIRTAPGYVRLKYNIINALPKVSFQFIFTLYIFYTARNIARISYFPSIKQDYTLEKFIQYSIQVFHPVPYITWEDLGLVLLFSAVTSITFIFFNVIYQIYSTCLNLHSEKNSYGYFLKIFYFFIEFHKIGFLAIFLLYIISDIAYTFLETPLFTCTLIISIIGHIVINKISNRNYTKKLNQSLGLPEYQSLNETKTSAELYYLDTKLDSLHTVKSMLEETQDNYTQWKNSSNINSDNINSSCE